METLLLFNDICFTDNNSWSNNYLHIFIYQKLI